MKWKNLIGAVAEWAEERGITYYSNPQAQLMKAVSELGELCDAQIKDDYLGQQDAVGDVLVCLIIYCEMSSYDIKSCLEQAYDEIKNRKGRMVMGGAFVKEE